jgi:FtsP/CotA-like multicopper oxidase with cupredoxin domain
MTAPLTVHRVPIHVAQRYSVIVETNQSSSANYWIRAHMNTFCMSDNDILDPTTRAVLTYDEGAKTMNTTAPGNLSVDWGDAVAVVCKDLDTGELVPSVPVRPPPATKMMRVDFSFSIGDYELDLAKVNGTTWAPLQNTTTLLEATSGLATGNASTWDHDDQIGAFESNQYVLGVSSHGVEVVDILLYSLNEGSHPFHLHGHSFVSRLESCFVKSNAMSLTLLLISGFYKRVPVPLTGRTTTRTSCRPATQSQTR